METQTFIRRGQKKDDVIVAFERLEKNFERIFTRAGGDDDVGILGAKPFSSKTIFHRPDQPRYR
jgi:hypothetical protein